MAFCFYVLVNILSYFFLFVSCVFLNKFEKALLATRKKEEEEYMGFMMDDLMARKIY